MILRHAAAGAIAAAIVLLSGSAGSHTGEVSRSIEPDPARAESGIRLTTGGPVTVILRGERAELCLGGVFGSLPPGCMGGPVILAGWDWDAENAHFASAHDVRWGEFTVAGHYDADAVALMVDEVIPAGEGPFTDVAILRKIWGGTLRVAETDRTAEDLERIAHEIIEEYPALSVGWDGMGGTVWVTVVYDEEGVLQRFLDVRYGAGTVRVRSELSPAQKEPW